MRRSTPLLFGLMLLTAGACTHSVAGEEDTTNDFAFSIAQTSYPPTVTGVTNIDVPFEITITNKTNMPVKVENISLQSLDVGDYQVPFRSRPFNVEIGPGEKKALEFWANTIVTDTIQGTRGPLTLRTMIDFSASQGSRHEVFVRGIGSRFTGSAPIGH
jgi:hypothetical protein